MLLSKCNNGHRQQHEVIVNGVIKACPAKWIKMVDEHRGVVDTFILHAHYH